MRIKYRLSGWLRRILFFGLYPLGMVKEREYTQNVGGWRGWCNLRFTGLTLAFREYDTGHPRFDW